MAEALSLAGWQAPGLEQSCTLDRVVVGAPSAQIERIEARLARTAYTPHRHDTYAIGVTIAGVQSFRYRKETRASLPGQILVLHPDELHDGQAGTEAGLRYRMLYLEPGLLRAALGTAPLPFVPTPVFDDPSLRALLLEALEELTLPIDPLLRDALVAGLAHALARHAGMSPASPGATAYRQVAQARDYLRANALRPVASAELERVTGLNRFALARQFRAAYATTPHRFLLMRRLAHARAMLAAGTTPAEIAAATGFADQSHLGRHFKRAYGLTPATWAALVQPLPAS